MCGVELVWKIFCCGDICHFAEVYLRVHSAAFPVIGDGGILDIASLCGQEEM